MFPKNKKFKLIGQDDNDGDEIDETTSIHNSIHQHDPDINIDDDDHNQSISPTNTTTSRINKFFCCLHPIYNIWNTLTFGWMQPLLIKGNLQPLESKDLYDLLMDDRSYIVNEKFKKAWSQQLSKYNTITTDTTTTSGIKKSPSLTYALIHAFGYPFFLAGILKFINDSCQFLGPLLLNRIIKLLSDPSQPSIIGYYYVLGLFISNVLMSLCLRQYFWSCYRVGLRLRSSVITSIYQKSLVISTNSLQKRTTGEITNLMSVDSTRLQELTPYLHAIWYSFYQITIAMYLLYHQLGWSFLSGLCIIILSIPLTGKISAYLKSLQKSISKIRDERIKITNEVLGGMKVIKFQSWEKEFHQKITNIRDQELSVFRKYSIMQALSGTLYVAIPLLVAITSLATYVYLGHTLDVATALTSLALFEILRFPLFVLPNVINNIVEARVSVERIQSYLLEPEQRVITKGVLEEPGILLHHASLIWEDPTDNRSTPTSPRTLSSQVKDIWHQYKEYVRSWYNTQPSTSTRGSTTYNPLSRENNDSDTNLHTVNQDSTENTENTSSHSHTINIHTHTSTTGMKTSPNTLNSTSNPSQNTELLAVNCHPDYQLLMSLLKDSHQQIEVLETQLLSQYHTQPHPHPNTIITPITNTLSECHTVNKHAGSQYNLIDSSNMSPIYPPLILYRMNMHLQAGQLVGIVGSVGSGKSSLLYAILGEMRSIYGSIYKYGNIAYVGQKPFIQNSTLKDNILFGNPYDESKYQEVLRRCALLPDLQVLPAGDQTEIGERGINVSGGQKARIALARAIYDDTADFYLLDDPLSAVDAHVGKHLFQECILPLINSTTTTTTSTTTNTTNTDAGGRNETRNRSWSKKKGVLLVTNALQYAPYFDYILVLKKGKLIEQGTFQELSSVPDQLPLSSISTRTSSHNLNTTTSNTTTSISSAIDIATSMHTRPDIGTFKIMYQSCKDVHQSGKIDGDTQETITTTTTMILNNSAMSIGIEQKEQRSVETHGNTGGSSVIDLMNSDMNVTSSESTTNATTDATTTSTTNATTTAVSNSSDYVAVANTSKATSVIDTTHITTTTPTTTTSYNKNDNDNNISPSSYTHVNDSIDTHRRSVDLDDFTNKELNLLNRLSIIKKMNTVTKLQASPPNSQIYTNINTTTTTENTDTNISIHSDMSSPSRRKLRQLRNKDGGNYEEEEEEEEGDGYMSEVDDSLLQHVLNSSAKDLNNPPNKDNNNNNTNTNNNNNTTNNKKSNTTSNNGTSNSGNLITIEDREVGDVNWSIYSIWFHASGGYIIIGLVILLYIASEFTTVLASWWLSYWSENRYIGSPWFYLGIYILINSIITLFSFGKELSGRLVALVASKKLFSSLLQAILYAPMSFFDTTPLGRIINRFSKDIYTVDEQLPGTVRGYSSTVVKVFSTILYIIIVSPFFMVALIPMFLFYLYSQRYYIKTSRELSRLDSISRSPIYALFSETLDGVTTIRAFRKEKIFLEKNNYLLDNNQKAYFLNFSANCWLAIRLEFTGACIVTFTALLAILARDYNGYTSNSLSTATSIAASTTTISDAAVTTSTSTSTHISAMRDFDMYSLSDSATTTLAATTMTYQHLFIRCMSFLTYSFSILTSPPNTITSSSSSIDHNHFRFQANDTTTTTTTTGSNISNTIDLPTYIPTYHPTHHSHRPTHTPTYLTTNTPTALSTTTTSLYSLSNITSSFPNTMYSSTTNHTTTTSGNSMNSHSYHEIAVFAGMAGLAISLALSVTQSLNWTVRMASDLESQMISVERINSYCQLLQEASHYMPYDQTVLQIDKNWPSQGAISMKNVKMRYRHGLPLVLKDVTINIAAKEKVGIVGRTGAGKSSLLTVFLRLVELESGVVYIDNIDISKIGLHLLRSHIAVIPQDPVLFSGTIRSNLDPFHLYTDSLIWEALKRTQLIHNITTLEDNVTENGSNYSVGQRQLICIARALLSKSKIIVMDEATAAVDIETDSAIQQVIHEEFIDATCLTVAHRLNTIMNSDKVLVLDDGRVVEYDSPSHLLDNTVYPNGYFASLVAHWEEH